MSCGVGCLSSSYLLSPVWELTICAAKSRRNGIHGAVRNSEARFMGGKAARAANNMICDEFYKHWYTGGSLEDSGQISPLKLVPSSFSVNLSELQNALL